MPDSIGTHKHVLMIPILGNNSGAGPEQWPPQIIQEAVTDVKSTTMSLSAQVEPKKKLEAE